MRYNMNLIGFFCLAWALLACGQDEGRCVVMHDAPSFLFITDINRFIFFKLR